MTNKKELNVALVCMPFQRYWLPSIQLGSLKSFAENRLDEVDIDILNFHLRMAQKIGKEKCRELEKGQSPFFLESLYAQLLYPELDLCYDDSTKEVFDTRKELEEFLNKLKKYQNEISEGVDWSKYDVAGFTTSLNQFTSSLYLTKKIKEKRSEIKILFGGTNSTGKKGKSLMENFKEIDFIISGEGELNFCEILNSVLEGNSHYKKLPGIIYREGGEVIHNTGFNQLENLDDLEPPEYSDYFEMSGENLKDCAKNLIEFSRGCYHKKCSFCSFSNCWKGYRIKSIGKVLNEIKYLKDKHGANKFSFCDNIFPESKLRELFRGIKKLNRNYDDPVEIAWLQLNSKLKPSTFQILSEGGLRSIFLGTESLSNSILKNMKKPNSLIHNIQSMKLCEKYGITYRSNLILGYPSEEKEIKEILENLDFVRHLKPLIPCSLNIQLNSEIWKNPEKYGIEVNGNEESYKYLFPKELRRNLNLEYKSYYLKNKSREMLKLLNKVSEKVKRWEAEYKILKREYGVPILYHFCKNEKIFVVRRTLEGKEVYRLNGLEKEIYKYCDTAKPFGELKEKFDIKSKKLEDILSNLENKKLIFESNENIISLSIGLEEYSKNRNKRS